MATIYDVAREAEVSVGTVSNVINGKSTVTPELRQRVEVAMRKIGYVPNPNARGLARGRSTSIGVLYPFNPHHCAGTSYLDFVSQIVTQAQRYHCQVVLFPSTSADAAMEDLRTIVQGQQVGSFILFEVELEDPRVDFLQKHEVPFVMVGRTADPQGLSYVDSDVEQIVGDGLQHLAEVGCTRIAHLGRKSAIGVDYQIYNELMTQAPKYNLSFGEAHSLWTDWSPEERLYVVDYFIKRHRQFDALIISEAAVRLQFVQEVLRSGLRIPDDFLVLGYMGTHLDEYTYPSITAFDVQAGVIVEKAVAMLVDQDYKGPRQILVPGRLEIRDSTRKRSYVEA